MRDWLKPVAILQVLSYIWFCFNFASLLLLRSIYQTNIDMSHWGILSQYFWEEALKLSSILRTYAYDIYEKFSLYLLQFSILVVWFSLIYIILKRKYSFILPLSLLLLIQSSLFYFSCWWSSPWKRTRNGQHHSKDFLLHH